MLTLDPDYVDKFNATYSGGKLLKAAVVTETISPLVQTFWVDHEEPIIFDGATYTPLHMKWDGIKTSQSMPIEGAQIALSNIGNQVVRYLKTIDVTNNEIRLKLLHLDLLTILSGYWQRKYKIISVRADVQAAVFTCSRILGRNKFPRNFYLHDRYPGLNSDVARIF